MPVQIDIFNFKCFNQLRNGAAFDQNLAEFTPNLVGNIGEKVKVEYTAYVQQSAYTEGSEEWFIINTPSFKQIERSSGSFIEDGIQIGDVYLFYANWQNRRSTASQYTGVVDFISSDGKQLRYTVNVGTDSSSGVLTNVGIAFNLSGAPLGNFGGNLNNAAFVKFGLIENEETFNFISKTSGSQQVYYVGGMTIGDPAKAALSLGSIKDWVTGNLSVEFTNNQPDFLGAEYTIKHEFVINPFYILSYREFIDSETIPDILAGDSSLKYAAEVEFRKELTNTGSSKIGQFDGLDGFVGWYGENFNGLNKKYAVLSTTYQDVVTTDPLNAININTSTKATIIVDNPDAAITDYSCSVYLVKLPTTEDEYQGTQTTLLENFIYKSEIVSSPDTTSANVVTSLVGGDLVIEYTIDYTLAEKLQLTTDDEYLLLVQIEDPTIDVGDSDRVMLIADLANYVDIDFLASFVDISYYRFLSHGQALGAGVFAPIVSNEDGIVLDTLFGVDTSKDVVVNAVSVLLIAYDQSSNKSFQLDSYSFNIGDLAFNGGIQQLNFEGTRGYPLPDGDIFNIAKIENQTLQGDFQEYRLQLGQKIKWQEWIFNPLVDSVFYNAAQPNNNLNFKASNYSNKQNYQIKLALVLNVSGIDDLGRAITGDFINYGGNLRVEDYDESSDGVTGIIETFDVETGNPLDGNILYNGRDTLFRATFQNATDMIYGIHRIEPSQNQGDGILELSNLLPSVANNLLKPVAGESLLKFDIVGSELTTECLIDGSLIQEGINYKLSARTGILPPPSPVVDVEAQAVAPETIKITWQGVTSIYRIYRSANGDPPVQIAELTNSENTYFDFDAEYDNNYVYGVTAVIGASESDPTESNIETVGVWWELGFNREGAGEFYRDQALTTPQGTRATASFLNGTFTNFRYGYRRVLNNPAISFDFFVKNTLGSRVINLQKLDGSFTVISSVQFPTGSSDFWQHEILSNEVYLRLYDTTLGQTSGDSISIGEIYENNFNLETAQLDALYNEIAALPAIPQNINFDARSIQYTTAVSGVARTTLLANGWTITDGGGI